MADLPEYKRTTAIDATSSTPDFGGAMREYASASWGSFGALGASVAQSASTEMAKTNGYLLGQNPQGDLPPAITDFDKAVAQSYHTQAYTTLSLQAQQMLSESDTALNQAPQLTPELINDNKREMSMGVQGIVNNAPTAIKPQLEQQLYSQIEANTHNYNSKMYQQNRETDQANSADFSTQQLKNIYNLQMAGNAQGALHAKNVADEIVKSDREMGIISEADKIARLQGNQDTYDTSKFTAEYADKRKNGKGAEFIASLEDRKDIPADRKPLIVSSVLKYKGELDSARNEYENISVAQMQNRIALDPSKVSANDMLALQNSVSPARYEAVEHALIQASKAYSNQQSGVMELMANWANPTSHADAEPKQQTATYHALVNGLMTKSQNSGNPIGQEEAEVMVARSAGAPVGNFIKSLNYKATSGNPAYIESFARQYHALTATESGHALIGVSDQAKAMLDQYTALSHQMPADKAAQQAVDVVQNQDPSVMRQVDEKWSLTLNNQIGTGYGKHATALDFALSVVNIRPKEIPNQSLKTVYGTDILNMFQSNYRLVKGDLESAKRLTKAQADLTYGYSKVNGDNSVMEHPLERELGYKSSDVVPFIHEDMKAFLDERFEASQAAFNENKSNEYWTTDEVDKASRGFGSNYAPLKITKHTKGGKPETFDVMLISNNVGSYDVALNTNSGVRNLFLIAPSLGYVTYTPNKKSIDSSYQANNRIGGTLPKTSTSMQQFILPQAESK